MNEEKLTCEKVPQKFAEWLLSMECPPDIVPTVDKLSEMCRGQYYMVWRSLMEHVEAKGIIRQKRLQVFNNDIQRSQSKNAFCKPDSSVVLPEELSLWKKRTDLKEKVRNAEERVSNARQELNILMDKVSSKLSHRNLSRTAMEDGQRRAWLLQQVAEELQAKKSSLLEARGIAESLCTADNCGDIDAKLDKVLSRRRNSQATGSLSLSVAPLASSSITSTTDLNETEDQVSMLVRSGGALWGGLCSRRAALTDDLNNTQHTAQNTGITPKWVLTHTAALHCTLGIEALKNKAHIKQTQNRLATLLSQLSEWLSGPSCELAVVRGEKARAEARTAALRSLARELCARGGPFSAPHPQTDTRANKHIPTIDKAIETKRDEIKRVMTSLAITERKIHNVRECLTNVFNSFHTGGFAENDRFGAQLTLPQESMTSLRGFYEQRREKHRNKLSLSMNLDTSENSFDADESSNPTFIDELKIYLKKFNLEKNRKLVLESGEKIWIFETLQASLNRLYTFWQSDDVTCNLVCPSVSLSKNIQQLIEIVQTKNDMDAFLKEIELKHRKEKNIDITSETEGEENTIDQIKKRLNENILSLQKTVKTLHLGQENLRLWSENTLKTHISDSRTMDGKTYKEYENSYLENLSLSI